MICPTLANLTAGDYGAIFVYLLAMIGIGVWFARREDDTEDYLLGGRAMPGWGIGLSYVGSLLSTLTRAALASR